MKRLPDEQRPQDFVGTGLLGVMFESIVSQVLEIGNFQNKFSLAGAVNALFVRPLSWGVVHKS